MCKNRYILRLYQQVEDSLEASLFLRQTVFCSRRAGERLIGSFRISRLGNRLILLTSCVIVSICLAVTVLKYCWATVTVKPVAEGVTLTEEIDENPPEIIHVLQIDLKDPAVHVEPIPGQDTVTGSTGDIHQGREEVRQIANRHGAVAGVNGDFFPFTGDPLGAAVWNGNLYSEPYPGRCVMGISGDGKSAMFDIVDFMGELQNVHSQLFGITGVDRMVSATDTNDLVVFSPTFGPRAGIRTGCDEVVLTGVNLPVRQSKLMIGTVTAVNQNSAVGALIPANGVVLAALPGGQAGAFLTSNFEVGDEAEFVCAMAPEPVLQDAVKIALLPRDGNDLPVQAGSELSPDAFAWATASEVIGGGPHLVVDGNVNVDGTQEGFTDSFIDDPNPRTGVGVTANGSLLVVTVDGRQSLSKGVSLEDFAAILKRYGAVQAMNLDGGGSTTMVADGLLMNSVASTGLERPVANALCVFAPSLHPSVQLTPANNLSAQPAGQPNNPLPAQPGPPAQVTPPAVIGPSASIHGVPSTISVGQTAELSIQAGKDNLRGDNKSVLWESSANDGIAYISQTGELTALQPGQGTVYALYDGQMLQQPLAIMSGPLMTASNLINAQVQIPNDKSPRRTVLLIGVFDSQGRPVPNTKLFLSVSRGSPEQVNLSTDIDGEAQTTVVWSKNNGGSVTISSDGLVSKVLTQPQE
jgi:exopolysaccharide biosynthesis protein